MPPRPRPNIVLITTDQQRADSLGCGGGAWMRTPHLDRLAAGGMRFDRAYCASPLCTPSRATIFTGQYPGRHGAWNVGCNVPEDAPFLPRALAEAGYRTHHIGKAHWQANTAPADQSVEALRDNPRFPDWTGPYYGFQTAELSIGHNGYNLRAGHHAHWVGTQTGGAERWSWVRRAEREFGAEAVEWGLPLRLHASVWTADRAVEFLERHPRGQPFFLHLGFQDPHHPHAVPREWTARVEPEAVPPPRPEDPELDRRPSHYRMIREGRFEQHPARGAYPMAGQGSGFDYRGLPERDVREARAAYYTLCQLIDAQVGRVLDALEAAGVAGETLVVFTSDHGELLGDHGFWLKGCLPYEELLRVPLVMRWPGRFPGGRSVGGIFSLADLAPTLLAAAGIDDGAVRDGCNWLPALGAGAAAPRTHAIVEHVDDPAGLRFTTIIGRTEKLTAWRGADLPWEFARTADDRLIPDLARAGPLMAALLEVLEGRDRRAPRLGYS